MQVSSEVLPFSAIKLRIQALPSHGLHPWSYFSPIVETKIGKHIFEIQAYHSFSHFQCDKIYRVVSNRAFGPHTKQHHRIV
jgi:hypothetical protein